MKKTLAVAVAFALLIQPGVEVLDACGAKFLVATRGALRQRLLRTRRPANILLYQHSNTPDVVEDTTALRDLLNGVGHTVTIADEEKELRDATRAGGISLVVMELGQARRLKSSLPNANILPVAVVEETRVQLEAKQEFGHVLKAPARPNDILSVVESALK